MPSNRAFTLIEILVVICLIGILAGILSPDFARFFRKNRLENSVRTVETTLQQAFSSSRATPSIFGVRGSNNANQITSYKCENAKCDNITETTDELETSVNIKDSNFNVRFIPPHGDMKFFNQDGTEKDVNVVELLISILSGGRDEANFKLYKKSGLIERQP